LRCRELLPASIVRTRGTGWLGLTTCQISYPTEGSDACYAIEDQSFWFRHRNRVITETVRRYPIDGAFVDVGGGNGFVARALVDIGIPTVLVEPSRSGALHALDRGLDNVICATVDAAGFVARSFGAAGLFDVLEHIERDSSFLASLRPLLKNEGRLFLTVPAFQMLWSSEDTHAGHYRRYTRRSLTNALEGSGFEVEFMRYFFSVLPPLIAVCRTLPSRLGLRRSVSSHQTAREHGSETRILSRTADSILSIETSLLRRGISLPFGGSLLAVARNKA
jgi:hypothetical protein